VTTAQVLGVAGTAWLTVLGLVVTGLRLIMSGGLVPRSQVDALTVQWEARLEESLQREQDWKAAAQAGAATNAEYADRFGELITAARTTEVLLRALPTGRTD
jgi:hypothetical protein